MAHPALSRLAFLISLIFHPLIIPSFSIMAAFRWSDEFLPSITSEDQKNVLLLVFLGTFLFPSVAAVILQRAGIIKSLSMESRQERHWPHAISLLLYLFSCLLLKFLYPQQTLVLTIIMVATISLAAAATITFFWKISNHLIGVGGIAGLILYMKIPTSNGSFILFLAMSLSLLVSWARFYLKAHTMLQLLAGFFLGMMVSSLTVCFFAELF